MLRKRNLLIAVAAIAVVLSAAAFAFAATDEDAGQPVMDRPARMADLTDEQREAVHQAYAGSMKEAVAELVENGAITQEEADKLLETRSATGDISEKNDGEKFLTDEQREAITKEIAAVWKEAAVNLVEEGALTQEEADAISLVPQFKRGDKGFFGILTEEQKTELSEAIKEKFESCLSGLVDDGTITQEQADQLLEAKGGMHTGPGGRSGWGGRPGFSGNAGPGKQSDEVQDTTL